MSCDQMSKVRRSIYSLIRVERVYHFPKQVDEESCWIQVLIVTKVVFCDFILY